MDSASAKTCWAGAAGSLPQLLVKLDARCANSSGQRTESRFHHMLFGFGLNYLLWDKSRVSSPSYTWINVGVWAVQFIQASGGTSSQSSASRTPASGCQAPKQQLCGRACPHLLRSAALEKFKSLSTWGRPLEWMTWSPFGVSGSFQIHWSPSKNCYRSWKALQTRACSILYFMIHIQHIMSLSFIGLLYCFMFPASPHHHEYAFLDSCQCGPVT